MKKILLVYLFLLPIPLFFDQTVAVYNIDGVDCEGSQLPLSFFCTAIIGLIALFYRPSFDGRQLFSISIACILFLLASIAGEQQVFYPYLFLLYLLPQILGYLVGRFAFNYFALQELLRYVWFGAACFAMVEVVTFFAEYGVQSTFKARGMLSIWGYMSIYGALIYYPMLLSLILFFGFFVMKNLWIKYLGALFIFLAIVISAAREPIAVILVAVIISLPLDA